MELGAMFLPGGCLHQDPRKQIPPLKFCNIPRKTVFYADSGCRAIEKREERKGKAIGFRVAMRPGKRHVFPDTLEGRPDDLVETASWRIVYCYTRCK
jgi:hypothetical protein